MVEGVHRTYRSPALRAMGGTGLVFVVGLGAWVVVDELRRGEWHAATTALLWIVLIIELIVEAFLRPAVSTTPEGVVLVNPFRTVVVPWEEVREIQTELALQIVVDGATYTSWAATGKRPTGRRARARLAAPAPSKPSLPELLKAQSAGEAITPPVECMLLIDTAMTDWRQRTGRLGMQTLEEQGDAQGHSTSEPGVHVVWHLPMIILVAVTALLLAGVTLAL